MVVNIYGKSGCIQCDYTKKKLEEIKVPYEYHDILHDEQARQIVRDTNKTQLPFVVVRGYPDQGSVTSWHGFRPDTIKALVSA